VRDLGGLLRREGYQVFLQRGSLYAFKGLAGRLGPIGVHAAMLLIMAGGSDNARCATCTWVASGLSMMHCSQPAISGQTWQGCWTSADSVRARAFMTRRVFSSHK
jgi:cytochrome c biogenesis protein ResB